MSNPLRFSTPLNRRVTILAAAFGRFLTVCFQERLHGKQPFALPASTVLLRTPKCGAGSPERVTSTAAVLSRRRRTTSHRPCPSGGRIERQSDGRIVPILHWVPSATFPRTSIAAERLVVVAISVRFSNAYCCRALSARLAIDSPVRAAPMLDRLPSSVRSFRRAGHLQFAIPPVCRSRDQPERRASACRPIQAPRSGTCAPERCWKDRAARQSIDCCAQIA